MTSEVRVHLYEWFVETGRPPTAAETGSKLGIPEEEAATAYRQLEAERVIVLAPASLSVWMANPLSAVPTPFRTETERGSFWGNCAWDGLGVIAMLGGTGTLSTACPDCGGALAFRVAGYELEPVEAVIHFAVPARRWWENIAFT